jgi:large subunit ribosomal protein L21
MKYAIVEISGRQFWIETGKYYDFNRIPTDLGKQITLNRVLLLNNDGEVLVGKPYLESVKLKEKF